MTTEKIMKPVMYWNNTNYQWQSYRCEIKKGMTSFDISKTNSVVITSEFKESVKGKVSALPNDYNSQFLITITNKNRASETFEFGTSISETKKQAPKSALTRDERVYAFYCFIGDAISGAMPFKEFQSEYGYEDRCEAHKIWKLCQESTLKASRLGLGDLYEISSFIQEKYPEVI